MNRLKSLGTGDRGEIYDEGKRRKINGNKEILECSISIRSLCCCVCRQTVRQCVVMRGKGVRVVV